MVHVFLFHPFGLLFGFVVLGGLIMGIWRAHQAWGETGAWIVGVGGSMLVVVLVNLAMKFVPRTRFGRGLVLDDDGEKPLAASQTTRNAAEGATQEEVHRPLLGCTGVTCTRLRPSGAVEINGQRVDVVTEGVPIDAGERVEVVSVAGNRVVVRRVER